MSNAHSVQAETSRFDALVVAHPDDEILWFGSVLPQTRHTFAVFQDHPDYPHLGQSRAATLAMHPNRVETLGLTSAGVFQRSTWRDRRHTYYGVELDRCESPAREDAYQRNYQLLLKALFVRLRGAHSVVTHSPWGEYGHEEHIQVWRCVSEIASTLRFDVWAPTQVPASRVVDTRPAIQLRDDLLNASLPTRRFRTDARHFEAVKKHYIDSDAWTWTEPFQPDSFETYVKLVSNGRRLIDDLGLSGSRRRRSRAGRISEADASQRGCGDTEATL